MPFGGLLIAGAGLAYGAISGAVKEHHANVEASRLRKPVDQIPQEFLENREIARQLAQIGLPQQVYNNQMNDIRESQANATAAANRSSNPGAAISGIQGNTDAATNKLNAEDAQARDNNQRYFIGVNSQLGARKDQQEQANVFDPYTRDFNLIQAERAAGEQSVNNSINAAGQLGLGYMNYQQGTTPTAPTRDAQPLAATPYYGLPPQNGFSTPGQLQPQGINKYNYGSQWGWPN